VYKALADAIKDAERDKKSLAQVALAAESRDQGRPVEDIRAALQRALDVMRSAIEKGLVGDLYSASGLVGGDAAKLRTSAKGPLAQTPFRDILTRALAVQEVNAAMGVIVAAPTAGLHFTPEIFEQIHQRGIETVEITLHVGLGTFQPVREEVVEEHKLHREQYEISADAALSIQSARDAGRRIVAVGTTTVRTLEFAARQSSDGRITPQRGEADIFIYPRFEFRVVGAMLTNFHLPKSTLLMLVSAFAGRERTLQTYEHAVRQRYRFYSYGDCMFVE